MIRLIEIAPLDNGAHRNQTTSNDNIRIDGWAVIPNDMELPDSFPFVSIAVEDGVVTSMEGGVVPEAPTPEVSTEELVLEMLADHEERLCLIELGV